MEIRAETTPVLRDSLPAPVQARREASLLSFFFFVNKNIAVEILKNQIKAQEDLRKCGGYKLLLEQKGSLEYELFRRTNWNAIVQSVTD